MRKCFCSLLLNSIACSQSSVVQDEMVLFSGEIIYMGYIELFHVYVFPSFENIVVQYSSTFASNATISYHQAIHSLHLHLSFALFLSLTLVRLPVTNMVTTTTMTWVVPGYKCIFMLDYEHRYVEWIWQNISAWYLLKPPTSCVLLLYIHMHKTWIVIHHHLALFLPLALRKSNAVPGLMVFLRYASSWSLHLKHLERSPCAFQY